VPEQVGNTWPVEAMRSSFHAPELLSPGKWRLSNWARLHTFEPQAIYAPRSVDEVMAVVEMCGRTERTLKPAGALHSWSPCAVTSDVSVQMGCLDQVIATDTAARTVRVQAGMRLRDLYAHLDRAGLALPCLPNVDTIQVGGAIVNATHGTCVESGSTCSLVTELDVVMFVPGEGGRQDGTARLLTLRRHTADSHERHLFEAVVASFGSIGIVTAVTLQCVEPYHSYVHEIALPFEALEHRFEETARRYYSARFMWRPHSRLVFTKIQAPIRGPLVRARDRSIMTRFDDLVAAAGAFANERNPRRWKRTRRAVGGIFDSLATRYRQALVSGHNKGALLTWYDAELESRLHAAFARRPFVNLEYAVPLDRFDEAVARLAPIYARHASHPMAFISFRPVGADDAGYLVASKGQAVVYVDITWVEELERTGLYAEVEQALIALGGRCSWARRIYSEPGAFLRNYPEHHRFIAAKQELDPLNLFANAFSDRICATI
jgi:FAD/FMN-containing dehydrogenase